MASSELPKYDKFSWNGRFVSVTILQFLLVKSNIKKLSSIFLVRELKKNNVFVRGLKNYGLNDFFRVSIGGEDELKLFIKKLKVIIKKYN